MSKASNSCRHAGAVGNKPTAVTKYFMSNYSPAVGKVLDFGSGNVPQQTYLLLLEGFDVAPYDVPENCVKGIHATNGELYIDTNWDVILLSNVLNVQASAEDAAKLVAWAVRRDARIVIFNLPDDPMYWGSGRPYEKRIELLHALADAGVSPDDITTKAYSSGAVYEISTGAPLRKQPHLRGCLFSGY